MLVALTLPMVALALMHLLQRLEVWSLPPLPHDPPPPPGYVDPLEGSELLADLIPPVAHEQDAARGVDEADPA